MLFGGGLGVCCGWVSVFGGGVVGLCVVCVVVGMGVDVMVFDVDVVWMCYIDEVWGGCIGMWFLSLLVVWEVCGEFDVVIGLVLVFGVWILYLVDYEMVLGMVLGLVLVDIVVD